AGKVTKLVAFGAFVQVGDGIEGLVHISEMAAHHVEAPEQVVTPGEELWVKIIDIDLDRRRISLSIKQAAEGGEVAAEYREHFGDHAYDEEGNYIGPTYDEGDAPAEGDAGDTGDPGDPAVGEAAAEPVDLSPLQGGGAAQAPRGGVGPGLTRARPAGPARGPAPATFLSCLWLKRDLEHAVDSHQSPHEREELRCRIAEP